MLLYGVFEAKIEYENIIRDRKDARVKKKKVRRTNPGGQETKAECQGC